MAEKSQALGHSVMFDIDLSANAIEDLEWFRKRDQVTIRQEIETNLRHQPNVATRNRKELQEGHLSGWELRVDKARVFHNVDLHAALVSIVAVGYKERSRLYFRGKEHTP
jgi:mRNA-degrading endonuclease RelE of RelBE toxin-antitoxin system